MLIGTYLHRGSYVSVAVEIDEAERPRVVLERQDRPGVAVRRCALISSTFAGALHHAERHLLARGGLPGAEAQGLASSPVERKLALALVSGRDGGRFVRVQLPRRGSG